MSLATINPATGDTLAEFDEHSVDEVERRISSAGPAFTAWAARSVPERAAVLTRAAELLDAARLKALYVG